MDVYEAIRARKSVRAYLERPVEQEKLDRVMEAARLAPSASNRQEWRFVLVRDPEKRGLLAAAARQPFIGEAPVIVVCCAATSASSWTPPSPSITLPSRPWQRDSEPAGSALSTRTKCAGSWASRRQSRSWSFFPSATPSIRHPW